ncbi:MAG: CYTH and CHAD domain-containing protein [Aestuariivirga sp.]
MPNEPVVSGREAAYSPDAAPRGDAAKVRDQEIEIKFRTDADGLASLLAAPLIKTAKGLQTENLTARYFDTPANALRKQGIILRVRKSDDALPVLGMKAPGTATDGPFHRLEVEVSSPGLKPDLALFDKATRKFLTSIIGDQPIGPKFKMQFQRQSGLVTHGVSAIEIAVDQGHIVCGKQRVPLGEVELELVSGDKADLFDLAMKLAEEFPLRLDFVSKAEKGFQALLREKPCPVKAEPMDSRSWLTIDDAVTAILSNTLTQYVANWACLRGTDDPESVHQMRVALRRMRCGLAIFQRALPHAAFDVLREDAGRLASAFDPVRNADAFRMSVLQGPLASADRPENCDAVRDILEKQRVAAYGRAHTEVESFAATAFVLKVQNFLARHAWSELPAGTESSQRQMPLKEFSRAVLDRQRARAAKRGKEVILLSDEARHKLRIALKNLRYSVEFLGALFVRSRRRRTYLKKMSALQDLLGNRNDIVVAMSYVEQLRLETGPEMERVLGFVLGWYAREAAVADEAIGKSWKKFKRADIFWN